MGTQHLIDSNAVIDFFDGLIPVSGMNYLRYILNTTPQTSIITEIEVLGFKMTPDATTLFEEFFGDCQVFPLSRAIVEQTISLRKAQKIKLPDAIIAATALVHDLTLITRNTSDFSKIAGLKTIDPYSI